MTIIAILLAAITILLVGILLGYIWGREDGRVLGMDDAYRAMDEWYQGRERQGRVG